MIYYLKRDELDVKKYDSCVENAVNSRIYAFSWYLDAVADNWDALILNDYEAVMPLPWRKKYLIKYIYPPAWTQQLGVFSVNTINEPLVRDFIKSIPKKFKKITIQFNSGNPLSGKNVTERVNYILPLNKPYDELFKNYRKDRRRRVMQFDNTEYTFVNNFEVNDLINSFRKNYKEKIELKYIELFKLQSAISTIIKKKTLINLGFENKSQELISGALFFKDTNRITLLFSSTNKEGFTSQSFSKIVNKLIYQEANSNLILDFEGSMMPSVASFNKSFGAQKEIYYFYQKFFNLF